MEGGWCKRLGSVSGNGETMRVIALLSGFMGVY